MGEMMTIDQLQCESYSLAVEKGFWEQEDRNIPEALALIHSEISEALEEYRKDENPEFTYYRESDGKPEGFGFELADAIIRIFDLAEGYGLELEHLIREKLEFNRSRPTKHGKRF
jgi:NTP pyrophosphatase (non-canonical NTP hydrolase)